MKQYRYGRYPVFHWMHLVYLVNLYIVFVDKQITKMDLIWLVFLALSVSAFVYPFSEKTYIKGNSIHIKKIREKNIVNVGTDTIFVLSYTSVKSFFGTDFPLNGRSMINVISAADIDLMSKLHSNSRLAEYEASRRSKKTPVYDNVILEKIFNDNWLYCFVYKKEIAQKFFEEQGKTVVIPRSLYNKIDLKPAKFEIVIDEER